MLDLNPLLFNKNFERVVLFKQMVAYMNVWIIIIRMPSFRLSGLFIQSSLTFQPYLFNLFYITFQYDWVLFSILLCCIILMSHLTINY